MCPRGYDEREEVVVKLEEGKKRENLRRGFVLMGRDDLRCFAEKYHGVPVPLECLDDQGLACDVSAQLVRTHAREIRGSSAAGSRFSPPCFMVTNHVGP